MTRVLSIVTIVLSLATFNSAAAQTSLPPAPRGTIDGFGTHFEVTDSDWLNITLDSSAPVDVALSSSPQLIVIQIAAAGVTGSADITLGGLKPGTSYWRYDGPTHTGLQFTADTAGTYTFTQDLTEPHSIRIQAGQSTYSIFDDGPGGTGGQCTSIGTWDGATKTCTLTQDVNDAIYLHSSGVTLDGAGYTVSFPSWGYVLLVGDHLTVKNMTISSPNPDNGYGVFVSYCAVCTVSNVNVLDTYYGLYSYNSNDAVVKDSVFQSQLSYVLLSSNVAIIDNTFSPGSTSFSYYGLYSLNLVNSTIKGNRFSDLAYYGVLLDGYKYSYDYWYLGNHYVGSVSLPSANNAVYGNDFLNVSVPIYLANWASPPYTYTWDDRPDWDSYGTQTNDTTVNVGNVFNVAAPVGGNYYSQFDEPSEGCSDTNLDGLCDSPFYGSGGAVDNLPRTTQVASDDTTAPSAIPTQSPAANGAGWNNADVLVTWNWTDTGGSGIDSANCNADSTSSGEGSSIGLSATCKDLAGNTGSASYSVMVDKAKPTILAAAISLPNGAGWYNDNVTVQFACADSLSGIAAGGCPADEILSAEGAAVTSAVNTAIDTAGNISDASNIVAAKIDKTLPLVALSGGPPDGSSYYFGSVPAAPTCSASDALSGVDGSCTVSGYSTLVGSHTVTATAKDKAGNQSSVSIAYAVLPWTVTGFYQPVDMGGVWNTVKNGSTIPLKFEVFAGSTELTDPLVVQQPLTASQSPCSGGQTDEIELLATGGTSLRYDATTGQFIYNWQTPKKAGYCYVVTVRTADGTPLTANVKLR